MAQEGVGDPRGGRIAIPEPEAMPLEEGVLPGEMFEDGEDVGEETETVAARAAAIPVRPTPQMIRDHMVAHIPFRNRCPHCVRGRARLDQHRTVKEHEEENVAVVSMDYMFLATDSETWSAVEAPVLTIKDRMSKGIWCHPVQHKGVSEDMYGAEALVRTLDRLGYKRIQLRCDREQAILAVAQHAQRAAKAEVVIEHPPLGEARGKSNGEVERANQTIQGLIRTYKSDLEASLKRELPSRCPLMLWLIEWASVAHNLFTIGSDGVSPYQRIKGRPWRPAIPRFGETVLYRIVTQRRLEQRWEKGVFLGIREATQERIIGTAKGIFVTQSLRRLPEEEQWDATLAFAVTGVPWKPNERTRPAEQAEGAPPREPPPPPVVAQETQVRDYYVTRSDIRRFGTTPGCSACIYGEVGFPTKVAHTPACRRRIMEFRGEDDERVKEAKARKASKGAEGTQKAPRVAEPAEEPRGSQERSVQERSVGVATAAPSHDDAPMPPSSSRASGSTEIPMAAAGSAAAPIPEEHVEEPDDEEMMEGRSAPVKRGRSKTMASDVDEAAEKTFRIADEDLQVLAKGYQAREDEDDDDEDDQLDDASGHDLPAKVIKLPSTFLDRLSPTDPMYNDWVGEAKREFSNFLDLDVMERLTIEEARNAGMKDVDLIPMMLVNTLKPDAVQTTGNKPKVRAVVLGNLETKDGDEDVSAQVPHYMHIRAALNVASHRGWHVGQQDITTAFLNARLQKNVFVRPPSFFTKMGWTKENEIWRLKKAVYGLRSSPLAWCTQRDAELENKTFVTSGRSMTLQRCIEEPGMYKVIETETGELHGLLIIYVDDLLSMGSGETVEDIKKMIANLWRVKDQGTLSPGDTRKELNFLGLRITRGDQGELRVDQTRWLKETVADLGWSGLTGRKGLPQISHGKWIYQEKNSPGYYQWLKRAQTLVGNLQWISLRTRPDVTAIANMLASATTLAPKQVCELSKGVFRYLVSTADYKLSCALPSSIVPTGCGLEVYGDASWSPGGGRSRSGWTVFWSGSLIEYGSSKQALTSLSSCEAELRATTDAWLRSSSVQALFQELGIVQQPVSITTDSKAAWSLASTSWRNRHFAMIARRLAEEVKSGRIVWLWAPGSTMYADALTKVLPVGGLAMFRAAVGLG